MGQYFQAFDLTFRPRHLDEVLIFTSTHGVLTMQSNWIMLKFQGFWNTITVLECDNLLNGASLCLSSVSMYNDMLFVAAITQRECEIVDLLTPSVPRLSIMAGWNSHRTLMKASRLFESVSWCWSTILCYFLQWPLNLGHVHMCSTVYLKCLEDTYRRHMYLAHHNGTKPLISTTAQWRYITLRSEIDIVLSFLRHIYSLFSLKVRSPGE